MNQFQILVPYQDQWTIAEVREIDMPVQVQYRVHFQDGYNAIFYGDLDANQMLENLIGGSELAKDVETAINFYHRNLTEPFELYFQGRQFIVLGNRQISAGLCFSVFENGALGFIIELNSEGNWVVNEEMYEPARYPDTELVACLGSFIEDIYA